MPTKPKSPDRRLTELFRARRKQLVLTVAELAARSGVGARTITHLELGYHPPALGTVARLARALDLVIDVRDLACDDSEATTCGADQPPEAFGDTDPPGETDPITRRRVQRRRFPAARSGPRA